MRRLSSTLLALLLCTPAVSRADAVIAPGPSGHVGAFLVLGPLQSVKPGKRPTYVSDFPLPKGLDEATLRPAAGERVVATAQPDGVTWKVASSATGSIDLATALKSKGAEATGLAYGVLRATSPFKGFLSLSVDDGVAVFVDGKRAFVRDDARSEADDDDLVPVELAAGDHPVLLKLHQHGGAWGFRMRVVAPDLSAARGVSFVLPGAVDEGQLAGELLSITLDRGQTAKGLSPLLSVSARGGYPRGVQRAIEALARGGSSTVFDVRAGLLPLEPEGPASDVTVQLPEIAGDALAALEGGGALAIDVKVGPHARSFSATARKGLREALEKAAEARRKADARPSYLRDADAVAATIDHLVERVQHYAGKGDSDVAAQLEEAAWLSTFSEAVTAGSDPFSAIRGARRVAYLSPLDGRPSPFALYVPKSFSPEKKYPLVVALHGLNGKPINMLRWVFGRDDANHDGEWEDRHPGEFADIDAIVVAPMAHGNAFYRYVGEEDVMAVVRWARKMLPVDEARISITGPSMGGTGTAWVAFRYADTFSAAAPLCGYHSYFLRADMASRSKRPWEQQLAEERSTISWAENGLHLPLYIVHGTRDLPEENSGVLIDRYKRLGYSLLDEHPDEGHNVWQPTYEGLKGMRWLMAHRRPQHPSQVILRTDNLRYDRHAWVQIKRLTQSFSWGEVRALAKKGNVIKLTTKGVEAIELARDEKLFDASQPITVDVDGESLSFAPGEPVAFERAGGRFRKGVTAPEGLRKGPRLAGPLRDVHHEPLVVVYGTEDPRFARANEEVARWFAQIKPGFDVRYPVVSDRAFDRTLMKTHAVVLVGSGQSNAVTRSLEASLPLRVSHEPPAVIAGQQRFEGPEVGAAFIYPNPEQQGRYVVVIAGATVPGTLRAMSLPDLLPDYVVYDQRLSPARGQMILGGKARLLAGGVFDESWRLPATLTDPVGERR